jgi:hypothetical protein
MAGGLLNIISVGSNNIFLTGNPTKTFFKVVYSKYTNFGLQKFRVDYDGQRDLRLNEPSSFTFKIPRHADLLMDTYIVVSLPDIWSPIMNPINNTYEYNNNNKWASYDFKWIKNLGIQMIREITITCGNALIQRYSGQYLHSMVERDFTSEKKKLFYKMTGNDIELNDPANAYSRTNTYPSAFFTGTTDGLNVNSNGSEPSIRGRQLFIPINTWFTLDSRCAFPLVALQYNELHINVTFRPIRELFQVRDVFDSTNNFPYVQPDFNLPQFNMYYFLQTPPAYEIYDPEGLVDVYENKTNIWNADIHLMTTYCFLSNEEARKFAAEDQAYLIKDVFEYNFQNITGSQKVKLMSNGMISSWMWFFQRNDVNLRNEWSNYTNWPYDTLPANIIPAPYDTSLEYGPLVHPSSQGVDATGNKAVIGESTGYFYTGVFHSDNRKNILETMGIVFDGGYRENTLTSGIYEYVEKYVRTSGGTHDGLYCYNFCLNTSPFDQQPSGAINLSKFRTIEMEITTYVPPIDTTASNITTIYDENGVPIGINKLNWKLFEYNYNLTIFEERYNILSFIGGNCSMLYAR